MNLFAGFALFCEDFPDIMKHQLGVTHSALDSGPLVVTAGTKIGKFTFAKPTILYVMPDKTTERTVVLTNVPQKTINFPDREDSDGEIDMQPGMPSERKEYVISREEYNKLREPLAQPASPV